MTKRNVWLLITSIIIGPLIGSVAFMIGTTLFDWPYAGQQSGAVKFLANYWPLILSSGYALGLIPAVIFAVAMIILSRRIPRRSGRLWVASVVGAAISGVCIGLFLTGGFAGVTDSLYILGAVVVTGAIAGLVCMALVELFHPLPAPTAAAA
jgi:hypothetical protein